MTDEKKPIQIQFAPGCFDNFDGTQEELDKMIKDITEMFSNKTHEELKDMGRELTEEDWEELPDEVKLQLIQSFDDDAEEQRKGKLQ